MRSLKGSRDQFENLKNDSSWEDKAEIMHLNNESFPGSYERGA